VSSSAFLYVPECAARYTNAGHLLVCPVELFALPITSTFEVAQYALASIFALLPYLIPILSIGLGVSFVLMLLRSKP